MNKSSDTNAVVNIATTNLYRSTIMVPITKKAFLDYLECPTRGIRTLKTSSESLSESAIFRIQQGREIEEIARSLFPGGVRVDASSFQEACSLTDSILRAGTANAIFEASVEAQRFRARADILVPANDGYRLIEVKSKTDKTKDVEALYKDAAYTAMVLGFAGVNVTEIAVFVLASDFRLGQPLESLIVRWDVSDEANAFVAEWESRKDEFLTGLSSVPVPEMQEACRNCIYFQNGCIGEGQADHLLTVPNLRGKKLGLLARAGIAVINDIPADAELTDRQKIVVGAVKTGVPHVESGLASSLQKLQWPLHFLDFETVSTAVPLYPDLAPWSQCVSQYSLHRMALGGGLSHAEFLADAETDCRRVLVVNLLDELGVEGDILVYSPFERVVLQALAKRYPDLAEPIDACVKRLVDLCAVIRNAYYHPSFRGSYSIKKVLPAMLPAYSYDHLSVGNGDAAITRFARMARKEILPADIQKNRRDLLAYCKQDTWAMVLLADKLFQLVGLGSILVEEAA
jgi:predicted RecB family nuclease